MQKKAYDNIDNLHNLQKNVYVKIHQNLQEKYKFPHLTTLL